MDGRDPYLIYAHVEKSFVIFIIFIIRPLLLFIYLLHQSSKTAPESESESVLCKLYHNSLYYCSRI